MSKLVKKSIIVMVIIIYISSSNLITVEANETPKSIKTLDIGAELTFNIQNQYPNSTFSWKSSNKEIATVNRKGVIKGIKEGDVIISCTVKNEDSKINLQWDIKVIDSSKELEGVNIEYLTVKSGALSKNTANRIIRKTVVNELKKKISKEYTIKVMWSSVIEDDSYSNIGLSAGSFEISIQFTHREGYNFIYHFSIPIYEKYDNIITDYKEIPLVARTGEAWNDQVTYIKETEDGAIIAVAIKLNRWEDEEYNYIVSYDAYKSWLEEYNDGIYDGIMRYVYIISTGERKWPD